MDRQPAQHLHALLCALDPSVAAPALQPLERLVARPGSSDGLIVAIVGASGVGKSEIVNALADARVVTAGPLRPTTTEVVVWGSVDTAYLPGARISSPDPLDDLALVDTPAAEHYPDAVFEVLDLVDAVIFVTSPERYADVITEELLAVLHDRGVPTFVVLSTDSREFSGLEGLVEDAELKLGVPIDGVVGDDASPLRLLLNEMVRNRDTLIEQRDRAAAARCAALTDDVAGLLEEHVVASRIVVGKADDAFSLARVDRRQIAATADEEWYVAAPSIAVMVDGATDRAIGDVAADVAADGVFSRIVADAALSLPSIDQGVIDEWHRTTTNVCLSSIKRRWLHPLRSRAVSDEMWKLSIDFDRSPSNRVRKALRDQLPDLRFNRGEALTVALRDAGSDKIAAFIRNLDPSSRVSSAALRTAATAVAASGSLPGEMVDDVA
ncbi:MAG: GTPase domain-containing protein [Actinomycetota bacterium]|nr:GTPase domain-containing protein [Actinomycetota bacterium]